MIYYLIYTSFGISAFSDLQLIDLLKVSQKSNQQHGITGMLYYYNGSFIQLLEGEEEDVKLIYKKICDDKRHYSVVLLKEGIVDDRFFPNWTMAFKQISTSEYQNETYYTSQEGAIDIKSVLYLFRILN